MSSFKAVLRFNSELILSFGLFVILKVIKNSNPCKRTFWLSVITEIYVWWFAVCLQPQI
jgi:hypothetical protein